MCESVWLLIRSFRKKHWSFPDKKNHSFGAKNLRIECFMLLAQCRNVVTFRSDSCCRGRTVPHSPYVTFCFKLVYYRGFFTLLVDNVDLNTKDEHFLEH